MSCRTRGGVATLCGYSEYVSPSVPPKKYRTQTAGGGTYLKCSYATGPCQSANGSQWDTIEGTFKYDQSTCATINTQFRRTGVGGVTCAKVVPQTSGVVLPEFFDTVELDVPHALRLQTQTVTSWTGQGCETSAPQQSGEFGILSKTLSDEDLPADAIARAGATWTSWTLTGDGTGVTCLPSICCLAIIQTYTTGFTFTYQAAQFRIVDYPLTLAPLTNYTIKVEIWRHVYGSITPFTLYQTMEFPVTTDINGDFTQFDGDVPNDAGFESYSATAYAVRAP